MVKKDGGSKMAALMTSRATYDITANENYVILWSKLRAFYTMQTNCAVP